VIKSRFYVADYIMPGLLEGIGNL